MFRFPSIGIVIERAFAAVLRFPLAMAASVTGTFAALYLVHHTAYESRHSLDYLGKLIMCSSLGLNLFLAGSLFSDSRNHSPAIRYSIQAGILALLAAYYFSLPAFREFSQVHVARFILFLIGAHLLVAFAPFIARGTVNGFWQFNKGLFLRILTSALYSGVLFAGLALALLAIDQLFKADVPERWYFDLWLILSGVFNTWFFLAGVPADIQALDTVNEYPKGLKIFTQFVLLPLVSLYLLILYAYSVKIIMEMQLPKGWVSYLVLGFSSAGVLSLLLIYPIRDEEGNAWIKNFSRWFYRALYPLIVLLGLSIYKRVSQYGITENRYFILLLAIWLAAIATYFLLSKVKNIKVIPVSLCLMAFLSSFGPWGAFSVSERSQLHRLERLLIETKILVEGKIKKASDTLNNDASRQIVSIVRYLDDIKGLRQLQPWFEQPFDTLFKPAPGEEVWYVNRTGRLLKAMGVREYYSDYGYYDEDEVRSVVQYYFYCSENNKAVDVRGYDYFVRDFYFNNYEAGELQPASQQFLVIGSDSILMELTFKGTSLSLKKEGNVIMNIDLAEFMSRLKKEVDRQTGQYGQGTSADLSPEKMRLEASNDSIQIRMNFSNISVERANDSTITFSNASGSVLFKRKTHAGGY